MAPTANFIAELKRMKLVETRFQALSLREQEEHPDQTLSVETNDLRAALKKARIPKDELERICRAHQAEREKLRMFLTDYSRWKYQTEVLREESASPEPKFPALAIPEGLPPEFSDYVEGAIAWHNPAVTDKGIARKSWERLLARVPEERRFKSTWAAFMLGRSWEQEEPDKATYYYQQTRELAGRRFADSLGLAAASFGLEARVHLQRTNYEQAIELYLDQLATGDTTAPISLRLVAQEVLDAGATLQPLARNPRTQRVITAYIISGFARPSPGDDSAADLAEHGDARPSAPHNAKIWLASVEAAGVTDVGSAEKLALAAYQMNEMELAVRWLRRAPGLPVAEWLKAKLWLRAGKLQQAAELLASVVRSFPIELPDTNRLAKAEFKDNLAIEGNFYYPVTAGRQVLGELGVLRLSRREYIKALDALLNAGFWMDAAYVADRVLTLDELKAYVDRCWPTVSPEQMAREKQLYGESDVSPAKLREQIRYLLARRLTRSIRGDVAREYYPAEWLPQFDRLVQALKTGWDESLVPEQRAPALFEAAFIARTNGLELLGTEVEPDWHIHMGNYEEGVTLSSRATNDAAKVVVASADEVHRGMQQNPEPDERFHYRYQAAFLGWEAASLMPNNSDETARVLCTAGSWLKNRDPQTADIFYKALVRRNRQTALGAEADRIRWFPVLDSDGKLVPRTAEPVAPTPSADEPSEPAPMADSASPNEDGGENLSENPADTASPDSVVMEPATPPEDESALSEQAESGYEYIVHPGDSLSSIARGVQVTVKDILRANPGFAADKLQVGQRLFIPLPKP